MLPGVDRRDQVSGGIDAGVLKRTKRYLFHRSIGIAGFSEFTVLWKMSYSKSLSRRHTDPAFHRVTSICYRLRAAASRVAGRCQASK